MGWFNYYGLAVMAVVMIPNIIYAVKNKGNVAIQRCYAFKYSAYMLCGDFCREPYFNKL